VFVLIFAICKKNVYKIGVMIKCVYLFVDVSGLLAQFPKVLFGGHVLTEVTTENKLKVLQ